MSVEPVYLDLDSIDATVDFTVKFKGKEHKVVETSVKDFIATARAIEKMSVNASVEKELELSLEIIGRTLPTIPRAELETLTLQQLHKIRDFVMTANGEKVEEVNQTAGEGASGNEPAAS